MRISTKQRWELAAVLARSAWELEPESLQALVGWLQASGPWPRDLDDLAAVVPALSLGLGVRRQASAAYEVEDGLAVLRLEGLMTPKEHWYTGTSTQQLEQQFRQAAADPQVAQIALVIDSPGGLSQGTSELADTIYALRAAKPATAIVTGTAASAAYHVASALERIVASPSARVGSIGSYLVHLDWSKALDSEGIRPTLVSAGAHKVDGNPYEPLTAQGRTTLQGEVDASYEQFVANVARGRGVSRETVTSEFGQGKVFLAAEAVRRGMADETLHYHEALGRLRAAGSSRGPHNAKGQMMSGPNAAAAAPAASGPETGEVAGVPQAAAVVAGGTVGQSGSSPATPAVSQATTAAVSAAAAPAASAGGGGGTAGAPGAPPANRQNRAANLRIVGNHLGLPAESIDTVIDDESLSLDQGRLRLLELAQAKQPTIQAGGGPRLASTQPVDVLAAEMRDGIFAATDWGQKTRTQLKPSAARLASLPTAELARMSLAACGHPRAGELHGSEAIRAALAWGGSQQSSDPAYHHPASFPGLFAGLAGKMVGVRMEYAPVTYQLWAQRDQRAIADYEPKLNVRLGHFGYLEQKVPSRPRAQATTSEEQSWIAVDIFSKEFAIDERMQLAGLMQVWADCIQNMLVSAERTLNRLCVNLVAGNVTIYDGVALFHANHGNLVAGGSGGAPSVAQSKLMRTKLRKVTDESGRVPLNLNFDKVLVPTDLEEAATQVYAAPGASQVQYTSDTSINVYRGRVAVIVEPELDGTSAAEWYAFAPFALAKPITYAFLEGRDAPEVNQYYDQKTGDWFVAVTHKFGASVNDHRGAVKNAGA